MMFGDHQSIRRQQFVGMRAKEVKHFQIVLLVRWVEEDNVPRLKISNEGLVKKVARFIVHNFGLIFRYSAKIQVRFNQSTHLARAIDERNVRSTSRERFDSNCSRPGAQIQKTNINNSWRQHVEKRFPQSIRRWAHLHRWRTLK